MRFLRRALTGVFILSLSLAIVAYAGSLVFGAVTDRMNAEPRSFPQREQVIAVNVVELQPGRIAPELSVFGEIRSRNTVGIRGSVGGTVVYVSDQLIEGGRVEAGEVLLRVDPADAQADLARREAELADAVAAERDAERDLRIARDDLIAAQEQADLRASALQRQRDLQARGIGTAPELEAAELADSSARQTVLARRKAVAQAEALIDQNANRTTLARLNVEEARRTLEGTEIIAAFSGVLSNVDVGVGSRITANEQVATLVDPEVLEVALRVSTAQYATLLDASGLLRPLDVSIGLDIEGIDLRVPGRIVRESPTVGDGMTGRLIFAAIDGAAGFRAGDFVTVTVREPPIDGIARLPATALGPDGTILVLDDEDRLEVATVELVRRQGDDILVRAPELAGRLAVAARTPLLGAGIKVRPIGEGGSGETASARPAAIPEMVKLDPDRRARLVAYVESSPGMPDEAKSRILAQLEQDEVPLETVNRLESRMGG